MSDSYSHGLICPRCWEPITNGSRMCRKHVEEFKAWLRRIGYGNVRLSKRESQYQSKGKVTRQAALEALADGPMTTPELARAIGKTAEGARYACRVLAERGRIEMLENGYRTVWGLADNQGCDNAAQRY